MQNQDWQFFNRCIVVAAVTVLVATVAGAQNTRTPGARPEAAQYQAPSADTLVQPGTVIIPASSVQRPEDAGRFAHTNYMLFHPAGRNMADINPDNTFAEYPASLACVYKVGPAYAGCAPANCRTAS